MDLVVLLLIVVGMVGFGLLAGAARPSVCMLSVSGIGATRSYAARSPVPSA